MNFKEGIGENCEFASYHPAVNMMFFALAVGIAMFSTAPLFIGISFVCAWFYSILLGGKKAAKVNIAFMIPAIIVMAVINTFFTHDGETVLFYINGNRITLEATVYGIFAAMIITTVIVWFSAFNIIMSSDKFIYLFGKAAPVLGLTLSMIFRFIPLLKARFAEISLGQKCMGRGADKGIIKRARLVLKEVSILISWSLESSIETADSMEARGYGLRGRTSFHLYKFTKRDIKAMIYMSVLGTVCIISCALGKMSIYYYPVIVWGTLDIFKIITAAAYTALLIAPAVIDVRGEMKWKQLSLEM